MNRQALFIVVAVVILFAGGWAYWKFQKPPDPLAFLDAAPTWTLYSLDPELEMSNDPKLKTFHDWRVLGQIDISDKDTKATLLTALRKGIADSDGTVNKCFEPRLGIHAVSGNRTLDLMICFHCFYLDAWYDGGKKDGFPVTKYPEAAFDAVFRAGKIPLAPKPDESPPVK